MAAKESVMQLRMDSDMKEQVEALYRKMGTTFADAIRMFAAQSLQENRMPFQPSAAAGSVKTTSPQRGKLARYANPSLIPQEEGAMSHALEAKHGQVD